MSFLKRLLHWLGRGDPDPPMFNHFELDEELHASLQHLAAQQQRPMEELAADLLQFALDERQAAEAHLELWRSLPPRQQEITALICLGYTNRQIAASLGLSPETVKSHVRRLFSRFGVSSRAEIRQLLADWDFSAWE
jgi:DNA-binding NarL/FixJ family response regulator